MLGGGEFVELNKLTDIALDEPSAGYHKKVVPQISYPSHFRSFLPLISFSSTVDTYREEGGKKKIVKLPIGTTTIGRSDSCGITLDDKQVTFFYPFHSKQILNDPQVSRSHAKVEVTEATAISKIKR